MTNETGSIDQSTDERRILSMMRKVLSAVARDTAPQSGRRSALSEDTVRDIKDCMYVISMREQELARLHGKSHRLRPGFIDQPKKSKVVSLDPLHTEPKSTSEG